MYGSLRIPVPTELNIKFPFLVKGHLVTPTQGWFLDGTVVPSDPGTPELKTDCFDVILLMTG